jgi:hypothetical protein
VVEIFVTTHIKSAYIYLFIGYLMMLAVALIVWYPSLLKWKCAYFGKKFQYFRGGPEKSPHKSQ